MISRRISLAFAAFVGLGDASYARRGRDGGETFYESPAGETLMFPIRPPNKPVLSLPPPIVHPLERLKRHKAYPSQFVLVLYNTERMKPDYMKGMLQRVFHDTAVIAALETAAFRHIRKGPYTLEVAKTKAGEVRSDAKDYKEAPPQIRYLKMSKAL